MVTYDWNEDFCRQYADGLRSFARFDHGMVARHIASELKPLPAASHSSASSNARHSRESGNPDHYVSNKAEHAPAPSFPHVLSGNPDASPSPQPSTSHRPRILDLATGPGFLIIQLAKLIPSATFTGQDAAAPMLTIAREETARAGLSIDTLHCSADKLAAPDASFDVVTCKQLLHEAENPAGVIAEAFRVLKPGGRFFLIDFDAEGPRALAVAMRAMLRVAAGKMMSSGFWSSYSSGLRGSEVRRIVSDVGFADVKMKGLGVNYFVVANK